MNVARFPPLIIDAEFHSDLISDNDLNSDRMYLRDMILAISSVTVSGSLARRSPGKLGYAIATYRWLTTGNRILRIYISFENPYTDFVIMCRYIINVYSRNMFAIKKKPYFYDSPQHIFNMIHVFYRHTF